MITYYELLEDNTIGRSTPFADVAQSLGLTLTTEEEIVYAWNGKRYFKGEEPPKPAQTKEDMIMKKHLLDMDIHLSKQLKQNLFG